MNSLKSIHVSGSVESHWAQTHQQLSALAYTKNHCFSPPAICCAVSSEVIGSLINTLNSITNQGPQCLDVTDTWQERRQSNVT